MTNSLVSHLTGYVDAMFEDIKSAYTRHHDWNRDKTRLLHELQHHGLRIVAIDLPALSKHFRKCLDEGLYQHEPMRLSALARGSRIPKFLGNMLIQIFHKDGVLRENPSIDCIAFIDQLLVGLSKMKLTSNRRVINEEVDSFFKIEQEIRSPSLDWDGDDLGVSNSRMYHIRDAIQWDEHQPGQLFESETKPLISRGFADTIQQVADIVSSSFGDLFCEEEIERPKHGPGVVSNQKRNESKYSFRYWSDKLQSSFPHDLYADTRLGICDRTCAPQVEWVSHEFPSRLIAVPKTLKAPRLIATEPVEYQWIQQLVKRQLEARICRTPISSSVSFRSQSMNQEMAMRGSISGGYATIDLSSASDRLSCWLVERIFRANWTLLVRLHACRTRWLSCSIGRQEKEYIRLKKFATQGSACTFPVQTVVYTIIACAAVLHSEGRRVTRKSIERVSRHVHVYGDDIIVPAGEACVKTIESLQYLGLKVNPSKSFWTGKYRESCGISAYQGYIVTPIYLRQGSTSCQESNLVSWTEIANNFHKSGYWHVSKWITSKLRKWNHMIPISNLGSTKSPYHYSFCGKDTNRLKKRWNHDLQILEMRAMTAYSSSRELCDMEGAHRLFQYFTESPSPLIEWESGMTEVLVSSTRPGWVSDF